LMSSRFDSYIDAFGDKLKSYNDTIIIRFMHEFEGDWYPWSLAHNNQDPELYKSVFRKFVNRIRARGASKVQWMWCVNGPTYHPVLSYNWIISAYPGDSYVDYVASEAYNLSISGIPYWRSFRAGMAEPYYYLRKYFPHKPLFICENGCRERYSSENSSSQTKAQWLANMDKELQTNFKNVNALIFFNISKSQDYRINSSSPTLNAVQTNIWNDPYYFKSGSSSSDISVNITSPANNSSFPAGSTVLIKAAASGGTGGIKKVEFFSGSTKLGEDLSYPYEISWNTMAAGEYYLTAKATDNGSNTKSSSQVHITLNVFSPVVLIYKGSNWRYLDNGTNQGTAWRSSAFNDSGWKTGNAKLGYGNGTETTTVSYGSSATNKYITTYFRKQFTVNDPSDVSGLELSLLKDDGVVIYLNGTEVHRSNMPSGSIYFNTLAPSYIDGSAETIYKVTTVSSSKLISGVNTIAVEIHQNSPNSSDICFDMQLKTIVGSRSADSTEQVNTEIVAGINNASADFLIYPNPNSGLFTLEFCLDDIKESSVRLEIINAIGQVIYRREPDIVNGCIREVIELDKSLPPGVYILNVMTGKEMESKRILLSN
ncbi:MAG: T9SS type A sorting domain-containing protein, partial [Bacteroidetes bacterium]|nr:T9SS type A sorting domain-containing protein [Bacteroidota bacterium]